MLQHQGSRFDPELGLQSVKSFWACSPHVLQVVQFPPTSQKMAVLSIVPRFESVCEYVCAWCSEMDWGCIQGVLLHFSSVPWTGSGFTVLLKIPKMKKKS